MTTKPIAIDYTTSRYRWVMLALCAFTPPFVVTMPTLSLPPMFETISEELNLTLVQMGSVWGIVSLAGIFFAIIGGTLGDRFGTRTTLVVTCLFTGVFGLMRMSLYRFRHTAHHIPPLWICPGHNPDNVIQGRPPMDRRRTVRHGKWGCFGWWFCGWPDGRAVAQYQCHPACIGWLAAGTYLLWTGGDWIQRAMVLHPPC